jgi:hypothetical protein
MTSSGSHILSLDHCSRSSGADERATCRDESSSRLFLARSYAEAQAFAWTYRDPENGP